jgi:hypothetical protein
MPKTVLRNLLVFVLMLAAGLSPCVFAQQRETLATFRLREITRPAGYIFAGRVQSIEYLSPTAPDEVATMRITFQVEEAIRGTRTGSTLVIREWAGLWTGGQRYRIGERLLLFLYPPSRLGLTSPVGGPRGRFAIDRSGQAVLGLARAGIPNHPEPALPQVEDRLRLRDFVLAIRRAETEEE